MIKKRALITGISGQDGSYLAEYLLNRDYEVFGITRRHSVAENQDSRLVHIMNDIECFYGDLLDIPSLMREHLRQGLNSIKPALQKCLEIQWMMMDINV